MTPEQVMAGMSKTRCCAILRTHIKDNAHKAMSAAVRGGFRVVEFTMTTPGALDLIKEFSAHRDLIVGAGTCLTVEDVQKAAQAGAAYIVSPIMDEVIIAETKKAGLLSMPGCSTPTEMVRAHRAGAQLQKLFPAPSGPQWVKQTLAPLHFLKIVPTSGVTDFNAAAYIQAGAFAVGFVNSLFEPDDLAKGNYGNIEERARKMVATVRAA